MRIARIKSTADVAFYHVMSRTVNGEFLFNDIAKDMLRKQLFQVAGFCGIEIVTYVVMSNHFHALIRVKKESDIPDSELLRRYKILYPKPTKYATAQIDILEQTLNAGGPEADNLRRQLKSRMGDVSTFMQTLKQKFTIWYNRKHKRFGTLWATRFTSTLVEGGTGRPGSHMALQTIAAYIDLNPVRAGIVSDPKDYRWCGYAEALATGNTALLHGLRHAIMNGDRPGLLSDAALLAQYRLALFGKGAAPKRNGSRAGTISDAALRRVEARDGKLTLPERLRLRVAWFTKGAVIGTESFVAEHITDYIAAARLSRQRAPRPLARDTGTAWPALFALRGCAG